MRFSSCASSATTLATPARGGSRRSRGRSTCIRAQLAPIRDRRGLAASCGREAFRTSARARRDAGADAADLPDAIGPVRVAYAVRWLELGRGIRRPAWSSLVTDPA